MHKKNNYNTIEEVVRANVEKNFPISLEEFLVDTPEPHIDNLEEAVALIDSFIQKGETITVVGDYDCDGISATTIMAAGLLIRGVRPRLRIPHRFSEGYGINEGIIDDIESGLLITVDNGIAAIEAIKKAKDKGLTVIITDHHLPKVDEMGQTVLPEADIILDPHLYPEKSDFEDYCGAGIAYRVARGLNPGKELRTLLVLASIATVADVMPLYGDNRRLLKEGLLAINERTPDTVLPGLSELLTQVKLENHIDEVDYGFTLAPLFNAPGRLHDDGSDMVVRLLTMGSTNPEIRQAAERDFNNNNKRKELVRLAMDDIKKNVDLTRKPIVVYHPGLGEGIVGLIAGRLCEEYNSPVIVLTDSANDSIIKGSARSIPEIHVKNVLDSIQENVYKYGGHAGAAGLSVEKTRLEAFSDAFRKACVRDFEKSGRKDVALPWSVKKDAEYDLEFDTAAVESIMEQQKLYAPYGEGNPKPVFHFVCDIDPEEMMYMTNYTHIKFISGGVTFVGFNLAEKYRALGCPARFEVIGQLNESWFRGELSYQFQIDYLEVNGL